MINFKFAFWGTPEVSSQTLEILFSHGYIPSIIITSPDAPSGRGMQIHESPTSIWAKEHNIKYLKPDKLDNTFIEEFKKIKVNLSIVVAYGKIIPESVINIPTKGTINIHYSLLPKYRGASPLESCLLNGDTETGISIQQMVFKLDSGPILAEEKIPIEIGETKAILREKLIKLGGKLLCGILPKIIDGKITLTTQDENKATHCKKINKEDGEINPSDNSIETYNKYRAFADWPGSYFFVSKNNKKIRVKVKEALLENGLFSIKRVIPEGKKEIAYSDFLKQINTSM